MEGMIRRLKVNALLFVGLIICLVVGAAYNDSLEATRYELPKLTSSQPEKIVEHSGPKQFVKISYHNKKEQKPKPSPFNQI